MVRTTLLAAVAACLTLTTAPAANACMSAGTCALANHGGFFNAARASLSRSAPPTVRPALTRQSLLAMQSPAVRRAIESRNPSPRDRRALERYATVVHNYDQARNRELAALRAWQSNNQFRLPGRTYSYGGYEGRMIGGDFAYRDSSGSWTLGDPSHAR